MNFYTYNVFEIGKKNPIYENSMFNADEPTLMRVADYDIDRDTINIKKISDGYIYQLEVLMKDKRLVYIGSTKSPKNRLKAHISNLKTGRHHNKILQRLFIEKETESFKFSIIKTVNKKELPNLVTQENNLVVDIASKYHNTYDSKKRKIIVVYSR